MKQENISKKNKKSNKGIVTIPFLLVLFIILFLTLSLLGVAMTLVHISVSQYMSYSTARKLSLSGKSELDQKDKAEAHYKQLREQFFAPNAFTQATDWFKISKTLNKQQQLGSFPGDFLNDSSKKAGYRRMFYGAGMDFSTRILKLEVPGLLEGNAKAPPLRIISFLGREPSKDECQEFNEKRGLRIKAHFNYGHFDDQKVKTREGDNGC